MSDDSLEGILGKNALAGIMSKVIDVASGLGLAVREVLFISLATGQDAVIPAHILSKLESLEVVNSVTLVHDYGTFLPRPVDGGDNGLKTSLLRPYFGDFGVCIVSGVFKPGDSAIGSAIPVGTAVIHFSAAYLLGSAFGGFAGMYQGRPARSPGL